MSMIENLEQRLDRVIKSATEHARFSGKLAQDMAAIESKLATKLDQALISLSSDVEAKLGALKADLAGEDRAPSNAVIDALDTVIDALRSGGASTPRPAAPAPDQRIDPNTGLPVVS